MPDRAQSTSPTDPENDWKELSPFRETFLQYVTDPLTQEALLHMGEEYFEMILDWRRFWPERDGSSIQADLKAVVADLVFLAGYLEYAIAGHLGKSSLSEDDTRLASAARELATDVSGIAVELGAVLLSGETDEPSQLGAEESPAWAARLSFGSLVSTRKSLQVLEHTGFVSSAQWCAARQRLRAMRTSWSTSETKG
jgi:hypothetical protein